MTALRVALSRVLALLGGGWRERDLDEEIDTHLALLAERYRAQGMTAVEARAAARRSFGGLQQIKEECRDVLVVRWRNDLVRDVRVSFRGFRRAPGFAIAASATLALGIGAATAIFTLVNAVLLRPLTYPDPDRLVVISESTRVLHAFPANAVHVEWWRRETQSFDQIAMVGEMTVNVSGFGDPESLPGARASSNLFPMLGVRMQLGRMFTADEDPAGRDRVVVLDDRVWRTRFGADPQVVGRTIRVDDEPYEVNGVLPRDFRFPALRNLVSIPIPSDRPQIWKPFGLEDAERNPIGAFNNIAIARLKTGVGLPQARAEMEAEQAAISARLPQRLAGGALLDLHAVVEPLQSQIVEKSRAGLQVLLAAVGIVLVIGCINVANLLLVKSLGEQRELGIRAAIGADRWRLARRVLTESVLFGVLGGLGAIGVCYVVIRAVLVFAPDDVPRLDEVSLDVSACAFTLALSVAIGFTVGLMPAWRGARVKTSDTAAGRRPGGTTTGPAASRTRKWLVGAEVGLSAVCLVAAALLFHSLINLLTVEKGFDATNMLTAAVRLPQNRYPTLQTRAAFQRAVSERLATVAGVSSVALANQLPLRGIGASSALSLEGTTIPLLERPLAEVRSVNPEYFKTWGIPLKAGRLFDDSDRDRPVAVVSEYTATHAWSGANPIGKRMRFGGNPDAPLFEVIGVVADIRGVSLDQAPGFAAYAPYWQRDSAFVLLAVKTSIDPPALAPAVRAAIHEIDPDLPVSAVRTMNDVERLATAQRRFQLTVVLIFAGAAVLLAGLGIYGMLAYTVRQRTNEIGTRLALGASPRAVRRHVVNDALRVVGAGLAVGVPLALMAAATLRALLFGVAPYDPASIAGVCVLLGVTAWLAAYIPARRAAHIDPALTLRCD